MHLLSFAISLLPAAAPNLASAPLVSDGDDQWTQEELEAITRKISGEVEELRGARFEREVAVAITDREGFLEYVAARMDETGGVEQLATEEAVGKLLGLIPPEMDLLQVSMDLLEDQVGGFYDPAQEKFYLMDSFTGGIAEVILSHELTHALDDQLFDIDGTLEPLLSNRDASTAFQSVVEGSGTWVMTLWTMKYAGRLDTSSLAAASSMGMESLGDAPEYVWKPLLAAYMKGQEFLSYGQTLGDDSLSPGEVIDRAFQEPPRSTEQVLHPEKYWNDERRDEPIAIEAEVRELPAGWEVLDESTLGELTLALLAGDDAGIDFTNPVSLYGVRYTNRAATGWGGDRAVLLGSETGRLLHLLTLWDSERDARQFEELLDERLARWNRDLEVAATVQAGDGSSGVRIESWKGDPAGVQVVAWYGVDPAELEALRGAVLLREAAE